MTWITDGSGTRWVEPVERKRRKPPRVLRFAELKTGDQLMQKPTRSSWQIRNLPMYWVVTDMWFDPVAGQEDPVRGSMVAIRRIAHNGEVTGRKYGCPIRGLAPQGFHVADIDFITHCKTRAAAMDEGSVVGIGAGAMIRKRPKMPGRAL